MPTFLEILPIVCTVTKNGLWCTLKHPLPRVGLSRSQGPGNLKHNQEDESGQCQGERKRPDVVVERVDERLVGHDRVGPLALYAELIEIHPG